MPGTFSAYTIDAPSNLTGNLTEGGSLVPNTTYYYKVLAHNVTFSALSPRSDTFSITTTSTHRTVSLTWTPPAGFNPTTDGRARGYIVLRNTSDSFPDNLNICIMRPGEPHVVNYLPTASFTDNGTYTMGQFHNFIGGLPCIFATGGTDASPITMWDIYQWSLTNLPGRIKPIIDTNFCDFEASGWKQHGMSWLIHATIYFGYNGSSNVETHFKNLWGGAFIVYGTIFSSSMANLTFGSTLNNGEDADLQFGTTMIVHIGALLGVKALSGKIKANNLRLQQGGRVWGSYSFSSWNNPYCLPSMVSLALGSSILDCDFAFLGNGYELSGATGASVPVRRCRFAGLVCNPNTVINQPYITYIEGLGLRHYGNNVVTEPIINFASYDITWRTTLNQTIVDGTFLSHDQTDNKPWYLLGYSLTDTGSMTFKNTVVGKVSNRAGEAISGATVTIIDKDGATVYSGSTDTNGKFNAGALTSRIVRPTTKMNGVWSVPAAHEDTHIANGWLTREYRTPHTVRIIKPGYRPYIGYLWLDKKMDLEVTLSPFESCYPIDVEVMSAPGLTVEVTHGGNITVEIS